MESRAVAALRRYDRYGAGRQGPRVVRATNLWGRTGSRGAVGSGGSVRRGARRLRWKAGARGNKMKDEAGE